jgi:hypothetical protein
MGRKVAIAGLVLAIAAVIAWDLWPRRETNTYRFLLAEGPVSGPVRLSATGQSAVGPDARTSLTITLPVHREPKLDRAEVLTPCGWQPLEIHLRSAMPEVNTHFEGAATMQYEVRYPGAAWDQLLVDNRGGPATVLHIGQREFRIGADSAHTIQVETLNCRGPSVLRIGDDPAETAMPTVLDLPGTHCYRVTTIHYVRSELADVPFPVNGYENYEPMVELYIPAERFHRLPVAVSYFNQEPPQTMPNVENLVIHPIRDTPCKGRE